MCTSSWYVPGWICLEVSITSLTNYTNPTRGVQEVVPVSPAWFFVSSRAKHKGTSADPRCRVSARLSQRPGDDATIVCRKKQTTKQTTSTSNCISEGVFRASGYQCLQIITHT